MSSIRRNFVAGDRDHRTITATSRPREAQPLYLRAARRFEGVLSPGGHSDGRPVPFCSFPEVFQSSYSINLSSCGRRAAVSRILYYVSAAMKARRVRRVAGERGIPRGTSRPFRLEFSSFAPREPTVGRAIRYGGAVQYCVECRASSERMDAWNIGIK